VNVAGAAGLPVHGLCHEAGGDSVLDSDGFCQKPDKLAMPFAMGAALSMTYLNRDARSAISVTLHTLRACIN
jgi:hypothetical protein